jgi:hypothetical protein
MSNKVDKLFKDKLEGHSLQPSAQAWEKVEAHLVKKNKIGLMLRAAAAIAVIGVVSFVGLNWNDGKEMTKEIAKQEPVGEGKQEEGAKGVRSQESPGTVKKQTKKPKTQPVPEQPRQQPVEQPIEQSLDHPIEQIAAVEDSPTQQPSHLATRQPEKGITLTYSLPPVKNEVTEPAIAAVKSEEKRTGLERVLAIAREVKNGDPLGELREAKDDIFAFDFRKDKTKKQH